MDKFWILSLITLSTFNGIGQSQSYIDNIKGKVQKVTIYGVEFEEKKGEINLLNSEQYGVHWEYTYNKNGTLDTTYVRNSDNSIWVYSVSFYSKTGKIDSSQTFEPDHKLTQTLYYKHNSQSIAEQVYDNNKLLEEIETTYSESGKPISITQKMDDFIIYRVNKYNKEDELINSIYYANDNRDTVTTTNLYNAQSDMIQTVETSPNEKYKSIGFKYDYDHNNSWVVMYIYEKNQLQRVLKRDILYY
jgi:hypothetical protein